MERILVTGGSGFIGTHLVARLLRDGHDVLNLDIKSPQISTHAPHWRECDIKDGIKSRHLFSEFQPTRVIHLAAKANLNGTSVEDFPDNTVGTANIISCVNHTDSVESFLNTSTQYVVRPGFLPESEAQFLPYTAYGESKAEGERLVRRDCRKPWIIIRPTNIWGPLHPFFPYELWRYLQQRYYIHPGHKPIKKYYGYVVNAVNRLMKVTLRNGDARLYGRVYYLTDPAIDSADWMNGFSVALSGKPVRRVAPSLWRLLAKVGDLSNALGVHFPMSSERWFRLTVSESLPDGWMIPLPEAEAVSLDDGIRQSAEWYMQQTANPSPRVTGSKR